MQSSRLYKSSFDIPRLHGAGTRVYLTEVHVGFVMKWHWYSVLFFLYFTFCQLSFHQRCISISFLCRRSYVVWLLRYLLHKLNKQRMSIHCPSHTANITIVLQATSLGSGFEPQSGLIHEQDVQNFKLKCLRWRSLIYIKIH